MKYDLLIAGMKKLAIEAGAVIMQYYNDTFAVEYKTDGSPVTEADKHAEDIILNGLKKIAPGISIVSEEQAAKGNIPLTGNMFFLVDPLDGTREFIARTGEFTVNIALISNMNPILGVIYVPYSKRIFYTGNDGKAYEQNYNYISSSARVISVRNRQETLIAVVSRSGTNKNMYPEGNHIYIGSSLKFCLLALGKADIYPRAVKSMEWDTAAGHAVLNAAGGRLVTFNENKTLCYGKKDFLNPYFIAGSNYALKK